MWKRKCVVTYKISVPSMITLREPHLFKPSLIELPIEVGVSSLDFLDQFDKEGILGEVDEINIIFISDLKDMTFSHYMDQPKSMLCRRLKKFYRRKLWKFQLYLASKLL